MRRDEKRRAHAGPRDRRAAGRRLAAAQAGAGRGRRRWLLPVMAQAAAPCGFARPVYPKAMLARLAAGRGIDTHVDHGGLNPLAHKIHVPLETGPRATLTVRGAPFHLRAGHAWEVNNLAPHGAFNGEDHDRIHFIFEVLEGAGVEWSRRPFTPGRATADAA